MTAIQTGKTPMQGALEQIEQEKRKDPTRDPRAIHRAAEVHFWALWYRSGSSGEDRVFAYAQAAILCSDLYFQPFTKSGEKYQH